MKPARGGRIGSRIRRLKYDKKALQRVIAKRDAQLRLVRHNARVMRVPEHVIAMIFMDHPLVFAKEA